MRVFKMSAVTRQRARVVAIVLGDTDDTTMYRDTKRSRRWYRVCLEYFLPARRYASAGLCDSDVSVRPSVCLDVRPSHAGIVPGRAKAGS